MSDTTTPEPKHVTTAFLVALTEQGWEATGDINTPLTLDREISIPEMKWGCSEVLDDITASKTSAMVVQHQLEMSRRMQQHNETQSIRDKLKI